MQFGQAAGLGPHAVGNLTLETEQLGRQRVQVNRVAVTGYRAITTAGITGDFPLHGVRGGRGLGGLFLLAATTAAGAEEIHGFAFPNTLTTGADAGEDRELVTLVDLVQVAQIALHIELLFLTDRAVLGNAVADMHQPHGREREPITENQGHVQREGMHMGVGNGKLAVCCEATHLAVSRQVFFVQRHIVESQADFRQGRVLAWLDGGTQHCLGKVNHHGG